MSLYKKFLPTNEAEVSNSKEQELMEPTEPEMSDTEGGLNITKDDLIAFITELSDEEANDIGLVLMSILQGDSEDSEDEEDDMEDSEEDEYDYEGEMSEAELKVYRDLPLEEKEFFKTRKRQLAIAKKVDRLEKRKIARKMKKFYKKNKAKIKIQARLYRKKVQRAPNAVKSHRA